MSAVLLGFLMFTFVDNLGRSDWPAMGYAGAKPKRSGCAAQHNLSVHQNKNAIPIGTAFDAQDRGRTFGDSSKESADFSSGAAKSAAIDPELAELLAGWQSLPPIIKETLLAIARQHCAPHRRSIPKQPSS